NRSFDSVLGWLYDGDRPAHIIPPTGSPVFDGLKPGYGNPDGNGGTIPVSKITQSQGQRIPGVDPNEEFQNVQVQIAVTDGVPMGGFYQDFCTTSSSNPAEIMECYTPQSLPVLNSLAKQFAVSDAYFSSI